MSLEIKLEERLCAYISNRAVHPLFHLEVTITVKIITLHQQLLEAIITDNLSSHRHKSKLMLKRIKKNSSSSRNKLLSRSQHRLQAQKRPRQFLSITSQAMKWPMARLLRPLMLLVIKFKVHQLESELLQVAHLASHSDIFN